MECVCISERGIRYEAGTAPTTVRWTRIENNHCAFLTYGKVQLLNEAKSGYSPNKTEATLFGVLKAYAGSIAYLLCINSHSIMDESFLFFKQQKSHILK